MPAPLPTTDLRKYALLLSYLGTRYCGWQRQSGDPRQEGALSIQGQLEGALQKMTGVARSVVGSGRTDSGVHASGQVAHFVTEGRTWTPEKFQMGLNSNLPSDIRVRAVHEVEMDFHAQRSASKKQYSYYFLQSTCDLPMYHATTWWIKRRLNLQAMSEALSELHGEHDFKAFQARGSKPGSTVRTLLETEVSEIPIEFPLGLKGGASLIRLRVVGTGFLKQMVRSITGTVLQVGEGKRPPGDLGFILHEQRRDLLGTTAAARGLWLEKVWYTEAFDRILSDV